MSDGAGFGTSTAVGVICRAALIGAAVAMMQASTLALPPNLSAGPQTQGAWENSSKLKRKVFELSLTGLIWLARSAPVVQPPAEERRLPDASRSAEVHEKLEELATKMAGIEAKVASQIDERAEIARLRALLKLIREEPKRVASRNAPRANTGTTARLVAAARVAPHRSAEDRLPGGFSTEAWSRLEGMSSR